MLARWAATGAWMLLSAASRCIALLDLVAMLGCSANAGVALEERKLPMTFSWVACQPNCRGWISAVGIVTAETPSDFDDFGRDRQLKGETVVLDSSGGSVNDAIALGRRFRAFEMFTTVGVSVLARAHVASAPTCRRRPTANPCAFFCCCRASRVTCLNRRMSACTRSGWATALTMHGPRATAQMIS